MARPRSSWRACWWTIWSWVGVAAVVENLAVAVVVAGCSTVPRCTSSAARASRSGRAAPVASRPPRALRGPHHRHSDSRQQAVAAVATSCSPFLALRTQAPLAVQALPVAVAVAALRPAGSGGARRRATRAAAATVVSATAAPTALWAAAAAAHCRPAPVRIRMAQAKAAIPPAASLEMVVPVSPPPSRAAASPTAVVVAAAELLSQAAAWLAPVPALGARGDLVRPHRPIPVAAVVVVAVRLEFRVVPVARVRWWCDMPGRLRQPLVGQLRATRRAGSPTR